MSLSRFKPYGGRGFLEFAAIMVLAALALWVGAASSPSIASPDLDPSVGDLHVSTGIYYQLWGMRAAARNHFEDAWEKTGGDPEVAIAAAVAAYAAEDYSSALQWLRLVSSDSADYPQVLCLEGAVYLQQARAAYTFAGSSGLRPDSLYAFAESKFVEALDLREDLAFAKHMLARIYAVRGEPGKALSLLREIPDSDRIDSVSSMIQELQHRH